MSQVATAEIGHHDDKALIKRIYTGSRALHDIKGVISIVIIRSRRLSMILVAIIAGTLQPNPMKSGMKDLP